MARGKRWQGERLAACFIGVLLIFGHVVEPYVDGQSRTVEAPPPPSTSSASTVTITGPASQGLREDPSQGVNVSHEPFPVEDERRGPTPTLEPAHSSSEGNSYTEEDFSSGESSGEQPPAVIAQPSEREPLERRPIYSRMETEEEEEEEEQQQREQEDSGEALFRSTAEPRVEQRFPSPSSADSRGSGTATESTLMDLSESVAGGFGATTTTTPTRATGSGSPICHDMRPFIDLARGVGGYRHRRRLLRMEPAFRGRPQSVRSGAGPTEPVDIHHDEDVEVEQYASRYGQRNYRLAGDLMLTLIVEADDFGATLLAIDRINELQLVEGAATTLGLHIIHLLNGTLVQRVLQQEVNYLKECSTNTIGIFVSPQLWPPVRLLSETLDYNIFPLPATHELLFTKAAHLLYELPWSNPNSSAMVHASSNELTARFSAICRHEHLCLESYPSGDTIYILLGLDPAISFATNGTLVLVLLGGEPPLPPPDLPDRAFVIAESDINVASLGQSWERYGPVLRGSSLLATGSLLLELVDHLNRAGRECRNASIECLNNWKFHARRPSTEVLSQLKLANATQLMTVELRQKGSRGTVPTPEPSDEPGRLKLIASSNVVTNYTTVYQRSASTSKLGTIFYCAKEIELRHPDFGERGLHRPPVYYGGSEPPEYGEMYWQLKMEAWVAAGLTVSSLGILLCAAILIFLIVRVCMDDILEGHPLGSILLLVSLIVQFAAFIPFSLEYTGYVADFSGHRSDTMLTWNAHCTVKIFLVSMCYCMTFSLLLCRAIMLASIGSEGGFLSHINGYIQSVICGFSTLVQLGLSSQLVIVLHAHAHSISCGEIYYGHWFWAVIAYDGLLLIALIFLAPFIFRSQRNYREGLLLVTGSVLCLVIWTVWIPLCMFGYEWREAAISLGLVATALAVLVGIMIPRCFLMVRSIARSDLVQALPSLTSLAFAQANQFISDQSVYECVNPAMRQRTPTDDNFVMDQDLDEAYSANSEIPTLPLRGQRRLRQENGTITMSASSGTLGTGSTLLPPNGGGTNNVTHIGPNFYGISNPYSCSDSLSSISPNKITRF